MAEAVAAEIGGAFRIVAAIGLQAVLDALLALCLLLGGNGAEERACGGARGGGSSTTMMMMKIMLYRNDQRVAVGLR